VRADGVTEVVLTSGQGGCRAVNADLTFRDSADSYVDNTDFIGTYKPTDPLNVAFGNSEQGLGTWTLKYGDGAGGNYQDMEGWTL
jgi:hypothetical protein